MNETPQYYLQIALQLAKQGMGHVSPNPMVGAVVVKNGKIIGKGFHQIYGGPHAEPNALDNCSESAEGAELYCTLEPCCHRNKQTPPCVDRIIKEKIKKVYVCTLDPNPEVAGQGLKILEDHGIETEHGFLEDEANELNKVFFHFITHKTPYIHLKVAQTLDGKMATLTGDSKWITDEAARKEVHEMRGAYAGVLIGKATALADNPRLNIRFGLETDYPDPYRIVIGGANAIPLTYHLLSDESKERTIIFDKEISKERETYFNAHKIQFIKYEGNEKRIPIKFILEELGKLKIASVLVEGGPQVHSQFLSSKMFQELTIYQAPKIIGKGLGSFDGIQNDLMESAYEFDKISYKQVGNQIAINILNS